jgi:poly-gamma-glutamate capsule biosynthesis protein CapA/YwtB (metallophosphatase superfamily)
LFFMDLPKTIWFACSQFNMAILRFHMAGNSLFFRKEGKNHKEHKDFNSSLCPLCSLCLCGLSLSMAKKLSILLISLILASSSLGASSGEDLELWIAGDVHLGNRSAGQLARLQSVLADAIGIVNLEGPVAQPIKKGALTLGNSPESLEELRRAGVRVVGIANNHSGDAGPEGLQMNVRRLTAAGLIPVGGPAGSIVLSERGMKIVITSHDLTAGVPPQLADELTAARNQGDLLIATFHVTGSASYLPKTELQLAAKIALASGATVVAAHGTHAIGPVERRGNAIITWGLGNLVFDCDCTNEKDAIILRLSLAENRVVKATVFPIEAGLRGRPALPARNPAGIIDLLEAIGSSKLTRFPDRANF